MQIDTTKVVGFQEADGKYVVFIEDCPKIVGRGNTPEDALADLNDTYKSIIRAVHKTVSKGSIDYCG